MIVTIEVETSDRLNILRARDALEEMLFHLGPVKHPLDALLPAPACRALYRAGIHTLEQICTLSAMDLRRLQGVGEVTVSQIETMLALQGRSLNVSGCAAGPSTASALSRLPARKHVMGVPQNSSVRGMVSHGDNHRSNE